MQTQEKKADQQASLNEKQGFLAEYLLNLERKITLLEKEVAELKERVSAQPEELMRILYNDMKKRGLNLIDEPRVAFEKVLPNGTKVVAIDGGIGAVGKYLDRIRASAVSSADQQRS